MGQYGKGSSAEMKFSLLLALVASTQAYRPLQPQAKREFPVPDAELVGSELYLTPYIESGDVETGRQMAMVDSSKLQNLNEDVESYSGFLTVDAPNNGNMFFWFFPAEESPETAPVVIWLQGGPGGSSMFGALKLHGPVITTVDENNQLSGVEKNPYSWGRKHNMLYIDDPDGSDKQPLRVSPAVVHTLPDVPEQPLLSLWRVLCWQIRSLTDPAHSREEPGGQRQDPDQLGWYGNRRWVDVTLPQRSLRQIPLPGWTCG